MRGAAILMRGLPGAGKSTLASRIASSVEGGVVVSVDDHMFGDGRTFDLDRLGDCHRRALADMVQAMRRGAPLVVVDNTHIKKSDARRYWEAARGHGYSPSVLEVVCDPEVAFARNVHGVPREVFDILVGRMASVPTGEWPLPYLRIAGRSLSLEG